MPEFKSAEAFDRLKEAIESQPEAQKATMLKNVSVLDSWSAVLVCTEY